MVIIGGDEANPEILEQIRKDLGFDRPCHVQLGNWFWNILRGDLGTSIFSKRRPLHNVRLASERGVQWPDFNLRFALTPTLSLQERGFCKGLKSSRGR